MSQWSDPIPPPYARISDWHPRGTRTFSDAEHKRILREIAQRSIGRTAESPEESRLGISITEWEIGPSPIFRYGLFKEVE